MSSSSGSSAGENGPKPQHLLLLNNSRGPLDATPASDYFCLRCSQAVNWCSRCQPDASSQYTSPKCVACFNHQMLLLGFDLEINPAWNKRGADQQSRETKLQLLELKSGLLELLLSIRVKI